MSDNPDTCANYLRIVRLLVDVGTESVRKVFYKFKPKDRVADFFASSTILQELYDLQRKHVITFEQLLKLSNDPKPEELDLSLLVTLIINLFKWTVESPKNGWDNPIPDDDVTLGACLVRLRRLRNALVGHSKDAKLSTKEFESFWKQAEFELKEIARFTKDDMIELVIQAYRYNPLDDDRDEIENKYISLLRKWHEEGVSALLILQREVEDLCKTTNEFGLFFKSNIPDRFKRYVLLLFEGGLLVLADILRRELKRDGVDLETVLKCNEHSIKLQCIGDSLNSIYRDDMIETDVSKWGLKKLSEVIVHLYSHSLNKRERKAISSIGNAYADYARIAMVSLDSDKFRPYWTEIVSNINILSVGLDDDSQNACQDLITKHDTGPVDDSTAQMYLLQMRQDCSPLQTLVHHYIDAQEKLKHAVEHMQREGACFGHDQVIELKMMTQGKTEEKRQLAENILLAVWEKAVGLSGDPKSFEAIQEAADKIIGEIKAIPGVKVTNIERHCIILSMTSSSCTSLLKLLDLLGSTHFTDAVYTFSRSLSEICDEQIIVTAFVTIDSILVTMESLLDNGQERPSNGISIKLCCSSVDAIRNVQQIVGSSETTNNINNLAEALSGKLEEKLSISTLLDVGGFDEKCGENIFASFVGSAWTPFVMPPTDESDKKLPLCSRTSRVRSIVAEKKSSKMSRKRKLRSLLGPLSSLDFPDHNRKQGDSKKKDERSKRLGRKKKRSQKPQTLNFSEIDRDEDVSASPSLRYRLKRFPSMFFRGLLPARSASLPDLSKQRSHQTEFPFISSLEKRGLRSRSCEIFGRQAYRGSPFELEYLSDDSSPFESCSSLADSLTELEGDIDATFDIEAKSYRRQSVPIHFLRQASSLNQDYVSPKTPGDFSFSSNHGSITSLESFTSIASCESRMSNISIRSMC